MFFRVMERAGVRAAIRIGAALAWRDVETVREILLAAGSADGQPSIDERGEIIDGHDPDYEDRVTAGGRRDYYADYRDHIAAARSIERMIDALAAQIWEDSEAAGGWQGTEWASAIEAAAGRRAA